MCPTGRLNMEVNMADEVNTQGAGGNNNDERTFTQAQLDAIVAREKAKAAQKANPNPRND